ncbi:hypothetical protein ACFY5D_13215 [Paeniglutamicibacter sp. NPDC012692]|uniref:hypothetical protein n=1 Tax=Paeniglutamicibacter sp. NPDC012692 TaxID=3364388 RepID=UPI0036BF77E5
MTLTDIGLRIKRLSLIGLFLSPRSGGLCLFSLVARLLTEALRVNLGLLRFGCRTRSVGFTFSGVEFIGGRRLAELLCSLAVLRMLPAPAKEKCQAENQQNGNDYYDGQGCLA